MTTRGSTNKSGGTIPTKRKAEVLWRQISQVLEIEIRTNILKPGERLPTEQALSERFGVNRHTVRRALAALAEAGVVRAEQGRGTFVEIRLRDLQLTRFTRFSEAGRLQDQDPNCELLECVKLTADQSIAAALDIDVGEPVTRLEMLRRAESRAVSLTTYTFAAARSPHIKGAFDVTHSIAEAICMGGIDDYRKGRVQVSARSPNPYEIRLLGVPKSRPILVTTSVDLDQNKAPICLSISRIHADRMQLAFEL